MNIIREWRKQHGLTLAEMAEFIGVKPPSLSVIECNKGVISGDVAIKVSQLTGISLYELRPDLKFSDTKIGEFFRLASERKNRGDK